MLFSIGWHVFLQKKRDDSTHRHTFKKVVLIIETTTKPLEKLDGEKCSQKLTLSSGSKKVITSNVPHLKKMVDLFLPVLLENSVGNKDHSSHTRTCKHTPSPPTQQQESHTDMRPAACPHTHMDTRCGQPCTIKEKRWAHLPGDFLQIQRGRREDKKRVGRKRFYNHFS